MILLYAYIDFDNPRIYFSDGTSRRDSDDEKYNGIDQIELNLSNRYEFRLQMEQKRITYKTVTPIIDGYWGETLKNVTALVGDNGVGKTSVLHAILFQILNPTTPGLPLAFLLQRSESEIVCYTNIDDLKVEQAVVEEYSYHVSYVRYAFTAKKGWTWGELLKDILNSTKMIYFSNGISRSDYEMTYYLYELWKNKNPSRLPLYDCSVVGTLHQKNKKYTKLNPVLGILSNSFNFETYQQVLFVYESHLHLGWVPLSIKLPARIQ